MNEYEELAKNAITFANERLKEANKVPESSDDFMSAHLTAQIIKGVVKPLAEAVLELTAIVRAMSNE